MLAIKAALAFSTWVLLPALQPSKTTLIRAAAPPAATAALWGARGLEGALAQGAQRLQDLLLGNHKWQPGHGHGHPALFM